MKSQILGLKVAGAVFALVSLGQALRLLTRAHVVVEGFQLPLWISGVALLAAGALSLWMWRLARGGAHDQKGIDPA